MEWISWSMRSRRSTICRILSARDAADAPDGSAAGAGLRLERGHVSPSGRARTPRLQAKGISSRVLLQEYPHLRNLFWGKHFWARGYLAVSRGNLTDETVKKYIEEQEGEAVEEEGRFQIDTK